MAEDKTNQQQTTTRTPGPYPGGGEAIWNAFLSRYFGDEERGYPGLLDQMEQSNQYGRDRWQQFYENTMIPAYQGYQDRLNRAEGAGQRYQDRLDPIQEDVLGVMHKAKDNPINLGIGGGNFNLIPQGHLNMAKDWYNINRSEANNLLNFESQIAPRLAEQRLTGQLTPAMTDYQRDIENDPNRVRSDFITNNLLPLASQIQQWRYGVPTTSTTGSSSNRTNLDTLGEIGQWLGIGGQLVDIGSNLDWGGVGDAASAGWDWLGNAAGNAWETVNPWG